MTPDRLHYITKNDGIPPSDLTKDEWTQVFQWLRSQVQLSKSNKMHGGTSPFLINGQAVKEEYKGETTFQHRKFYINDILRQIRLGYTDYVYHIFNIAELIKYEHSRLRTKYDQNGKYFIVWLDN